MKMFPTVCWLSAERAYDALEEKGYTKEEINVMMSDDNRKKYFSEEDESELGRG